MPWLQLTTWHFQFVPGIGYGTCCGFFLSGSVLPWHLLLCQGQWGWGFQETVVSFLYELGWREHRWDAGGNLCRRTISTNEMIMFNIVNDHLLPKFRYISPCSNHLRGCFLISYWSIVVTCCCYLFLLPVFVTCCCWLSRWSSATLKSISRMSFGHWFSASVILWTYLDYGWLERELGL